MRLIGYSTQESRFIGKGVYLPLGDLTVLLGANDAGKSTLLRTLAADLTEDGRSFEAGGGCAFYFGTDDGELALLSDMRRTAPSHTSLFGMWAHGEYRGTNASPRQEHEETLEAHQRTLREAAVSPGFDVVLAALAHSSLVCVERHDPAHFSDPGWRVHWCLPPVGELDGVIIGALKASGLDRFVAERERAEGKELSVRRGARRGVPVWLRMEQAPVIVAPLGTLKAPMPRTLSVPAQPAEIRQTIVNSLRELVNVRRWGEHDAWRNYEFDEGDDLAERKGLKALLDDAGDGSWRPAQIAVGALHLLTSTANGQLPEFVGARYRLDVTFTPVRQWFEGEVVDIKLQHLDGRQGSTEFDVENVADGLRLWLQLALLAGVDVVERLARGMASLADREVEAFQAFSAYGDDDEEPPASVFGAAASQVEALVAGTSALIPDLPGFDDRGPVRIPSRILLADEPEQHLNPRLQRRAARWLADLADAAEMPCIAASHSAAFLSLPPGAQMVHVHRDERQVQLRAFDAQETADLDSVAADLGFDRGELLSGVSCLLLVEGEHEIVTFQGIFGRQLSEAKISLVALRGSPPKGLLEVDALWRFTTAAIAICLDNVRPDRVAAAQAGDDEALRDLRTSQANEEKAVAALIDRARRFHRELHLLGHPGVDLIDALDPTAIRHVYPCFPATHPQADTAYREAVIAAKEANATKPGRKSFYELSYKIPNSRHAYELIADAHRELGLEPPDLASVVAAAVRASTAADLASLGLRQP